MTKQTLGRGDRTRGALVEASLALFAEKGVDRTSVDEITAAARVAKGTFYVHFARKEDTLLEYAARLVGDLWVDDEDIRAEEALIAVGRRLAAAAQAVPRALTARALREVIGHREDWVRVLKARPTLAEVLLPVIEHGQGEGVFRDDLTARRLAQGLTILWLDSVIGWAERGTELAVEVDVDRATRLFLDGVRSRG